jgi:hypothetical protein
MADTSYKRRSPFGIALLVVSLLALLFVLFLMTQRGGDVDGPDADTEQVEPVEAR